MIGIPVFSGMSYNRKPAFGSSEFNYQTATHQQLIDHAKETATRHGADFRDFEALIREVSKREGLTLDTMKGILEPFLNLGTSQGSNNNWTIRRVLSLVVDDGKAGLGITGTPFFLNQELKKWVVKKIRERRYDSRVDPKQSEQEDGIKTYLIELLAKRLYGES